MDTCYFRSSCAFVDYLKERRPVTLDDVKREYCDSNYSDCARFLVSRVQGPDNVSRYLFPEDVTEAWEIIDSLS